MNFKVEQYFPVFNMTWLTKKSQIIEQSQHRNPNTPQMHVLGMLSSCQTNFFKPQLREKQGDN